MKTTREKILHLLKNHQIISGEHIAQQLDLSRTAVWKQIQQLKTKGYQINSIKNKGYRLVSSPDLPVSEEITIDLKTMLIGKTVHYFPFLPSTNTYAKSLIQKKHSDGTVIVSSVQTMGKGRKTRTWYSKQGGLWFSVILHPPLLPSQAMSVTMAASVAIVKAIKHITNMKSFIKWPNDILLNGKKIAGILTELDAEIDSIHYMIIGMGINVNNDLDPSLKKKATTLKQETQSTVSIVQLLRKILMEFDFLYEQVQAKHLHLIQQEWINHTDIIGKTIRVKKEHTIIEGKATGITETGGLKLNTEQGRQEIITGDIEYI